MTTPTEEEIAADEIGKGLFMFLCDATRLYAGISSITPQSTVDAAVVFLVKTVLECKDPASDYGAFKRSLIERIEESLDDAEALLSSEHN